VYRELLGAEAITLTPLSRRVSLPLSTTESILDRLAMEGVVSISKTGNRRSYTAAKPVVLKQNLERKIREVVGVLPLLESLQTKPHGEAKTRIYYRERMGDIFDAAMRAKNSLVYEIVAARDFQEILGERYHFTRRRLEHGVKLKSLRVESREIKKYSREKNLKELREAKFLPRELTFQATILFWDTTVALFTTKSEGLALTIQSPALAETMKQLFNLLWSVGRMVDVA
jgi:hypothetical protein